jgi:hypothetical protein
MSPCRCKICGCSNYCECGENYCVEHLLIALSEKHEEEEIKERKD